jgi:hypothetical protein
VTASEPQRTIVAASAIPQPVTGEFASVSSPPSMLGKVFLDRYRVIGHLGDGGMGSVYLVEHTTILKKLAIKVLSPALAVRADFTDRFPPRGARRLGDQPPERRRDHRLRRDRHR